MREGLFFVYLRMLKEMTRERVRSRESGVRTESTHAQNYDDTWACMSAALELKCGLIAARGGRGQSAACSSRQQLQADEQVIRCAIQIQAAGAE